MRLRRLPQAAVVVLIWASSALLCQTPPPTQAANAPAGPAPPAPTKSAPSHVLFLYTVPRSTVEMEVHTVPSTDEARLDRLRAAFHVAKCDGDRMGEQPVTPKHGPPGSNLICTWSGERSGERPGDPGPGIIIVAAHYERDGQGDGALAGWSGAALLPFLYQGIQGQPRENTFVFLESYGAEGVQTWLKSISHEERKRIRAMIDLDALGLGVTRYFTTFGFMETTPAAALHLQLSLLWAAVDEGLTKPPIATSPHHWLSIDATSPFRALMIPTIVIHSVPPEAERVPGSPADTAAAVDGNAYFQSYHLVCTWLATLDHLAKKLALDDPFWKTPPNTDVRPADESPRVGFRATSGGHLMPGPPGSPGH